MSANLLWSNVQTYSLQIGLLIGVAAFLPSLLRLRVAGARLLYWQILLAACLLLPLLRPARRAVVTGEVQVSTANVRLAPASQAPARTIPSGPILLALLGAGMVARFGWLSVGLWKLRRYRRHSTPLDRTCTTTDLRLSDEVSSPVTFGVRRPVVLLPANFPDLDRTMQDAILCHELLHVERYDWLFTVAEEIVRSVFWFHPAIWWLLGEIGLAREQEVDRLVVERTQAREAYVDALLAIAGARPQLDLAPAPLFLRKRHLKQRVVSILKESRMSKTSWISALTLGLCILAAACWFVTGALPLVASPQVVTDAAGVTVDVGGATLVHRSPVSYPYEARRKGIQGTVTLELRMDSTGSVIDAHVIGGPDELRRAALESVLQWHFTRDMGASRVVNISFQAPPPATGAPESGRLPVPAAQDKPAPGLEQFAKVQRPSENLTIKGLNVSGFSDQARAELLSRIGIHEGDTLGREALAKIQAAVREFDEHATFGIRLMGSDSAVITISAPGASSVPRGGVLGGIIGSVPAPAPAGPPVPSDAVKVPGSIQSGQIVQQPRPVYPALAKQARIQGTVKLSAWIAKDGTVARLEVLSGHPLLVPAALDAVRQWVYQPYQVDGKPVDVLTDIDVNFTLNQ